jgi:hypothetical protein
MGSFGSPCFLFAAFSVESNNFFIFSCFLPHFPLATEIEMGYNTEVYAFVYAYDTLPLGQ